MRLRGTGCLFLPRYRKRGQTEYKASSIWWWKCGSARMPTGCRNRQDAEAWALERLVEMGRGGLVGQRLRPLRYEDLERMLIDRHTLEQRRGHLGSSLRHLRRAFAGWDAKAITTDWITRYAGKRRQAGAAVATVNVELARLRRMLRLAHDAGRLDRVPKVTPLPGANVRRGFLEEGDFRAILEHVPEKYRPPLRFLRLTGWRLMEALGLEWRRVDFDAQEIRLDSSKTGEPRVLAFGGYAPLSELLEARRAARRELCPWVFPGRAGRALDKNTVQRAWKKAREQAGHPAALIHDLRRTFVREMERAGFPRSVAMSITGHQSEDIYRRYAVVSGKDQEMWLGSLRESGSGRAMLPFRQPEAASADE